MKKKILLTLVGILLLVAAIIGIKASQIMDLIAAGKTFQIPPISIQVTEAITAAYDARASMRALTAWSRSALLRQAASLINERAEALVHALASRGLRIVSLVEQESVGRLAMARLATDDGLSIDLLIASSGIESEVVMSAETLEVVRGMLLI